MKITIQLLILSCAFSITACNNAPQGEQVDAGEEMQQQENSTSSDNAVTYVVNTEESKINWVGSKLVGKQHTGYILLDEGQLVAEAGNITGGTFTIDMSTITDTDLQPGDGKEKLEGHLKSEDFFHVEAHPTATFTVVNAEPVQGEANVTHRITGNLTMRGNTKSVTIPAKVMLSENTLSASTPQFTIDRTQWEVMYGSGALGLAQDKVINDKVGLQIELQAVPQEAEAAAPAQDNPQESK